MIKKVLATTSIPINLSNVGNRSGIRATDDVSSIIGNVVTILITIAVIAVLFMLIFGAFEWIVSGGEKEKVANARNRITHALIGLAILGLAFVILTVVGNIIGVNVLDPASFEIPSLFKGIPTATPAVITPGA